MMTGTEVDESAISAGTRARSGVDVIPASIGDASIQVIEPANRPVNDRVDLAFEAFGLRIGISLYDAALLEAVITCLPPGWSPIDDGELDREYRLDWVEAGSAGVSPLAVRLKVGDDVAAWAPYPDLILDALESNLQRYVSEYAKPCLFVHAGVVRWRGVTIMLPGKSFAGKSTLVRALVSAGAEYYSDEYAVLDHEGYVSPYARRLSLRDGPLGPAGRIDLSPHVSPDNEAAGPVPVDLVIVTRFERDAAWTAEPLGHAAAMMALFEHTVAIQRRPADAFAILGKVAERAEVYQGVRGDLDVAVTRLEEVATRLDKQRRS